MNKFHPIWFFLCLSLTFVFGMMFWIGNEKFFLWVGIGYAAVIFFILTMRLGWEWVKQQALDAYSAWKNISIRTPEYLDAVAATEMYRSASTLNAAQTAMVTRRYIFSVMVLGKTEDEDEQYYRVEDPPYLIPQSFVDWYLKDATDLIKVPATSRISQSNSRKAANALVNEIIRKGWADGKITSPEDPRNDTVYWKNRRAAYRRLRVPVREETPNDFSAVDWKRVDQIEREMDQAHQPEEKEVEA